MSSRTLVSPSSAISETPVRHVFAATLADGYRSPATQAMLEILVGVAERHASRRPPRLELVAAGA